MVLETLLAAAGSPNIFTSIHNTAAKHGRCLYSSIVAPISSDCSNHVTSTCAGNWRSRYGRSFHDFYNKLASLLEFVDLAGPVSRWLPLSDITVTSKMALDFSYACIAYDAADLIINYKPHLAAEGGFEYSNMATFLVTKSNDQAALKVRLVKAAQAAQIYDSIADARTGASSWSLSKLFSLRSSGCVFPPIIPGSDIVVCTASEACLTLEKTPAQELPVDRHQATVLKKNAVSGSTVDPVVTLARSAVGPYQDDTRNTHPMLGQLVAEALDAVCKRKVSVGVCEVTLWGSNGGGQQVPLWVLHWGT